MKIIVVGGNSKDVGKTSVVAGIISGFPNLSWSAVKISQDEHHFEIREEKDLAGDGDTCRFLRAGAKRSIWVGTRKEMLPKALPQLWQMIAADPYVIFESNSIMRFIKPDLYLMLIDYSASDFKKSAKQYLNLADAYVLIELEPHVDTPPWEVPLKPSFKVRARQAAPLLITPEILNFIRQKIFD